MENSQKYEQGFIIDPLVLPPTARVSEVKAVKEKHGYSGIPITETGKMGAKLIGLVTHRDFDFLSENQWTLPVSEVNLRPVVLEGGRRARKVPGQISGISLFVKSSFDSFFVKIFFLVPFLFNLGK